MAFVRAIARRYGTQQSAVARLPRRVQVAKKRTLTRLGDKIRTDVPKPPSGLATEPGSELSDLGKQSQRKQDKNISELLDRIVAVSSNSGCYVDHNFVQTAHAGKRAAIRFPFLHVAFAIGSANDEGVIARRIRHPAMF